MIDFTEQMNDLSTMYDASRKHCVEREKQHFQNLLVSMRKFIGAFDERIKVDEKIESLQDKVKAIIDRGQSCENECECCEDEDEE